MKKLLSLMLALSFVFCLTACADKGGKTDNNSIDVKYYANLGQINNADYKLGEDVESVKQKLNAEQSDSSGEDEPFYYDFQSGDYTVLTDGLVCCCYKTENSGGGITHIVKYGDAYGFAQSTISTEVRDAMSDMGYTATERDVKSGELFFMPSASGLTVLQYDFDKNSVLFVFQESALSATIIYAR